MLSVVVPAHDAGAWLDELLGSVLEQGIDDMEVLVVDDRSSDETVGVVEAVQAHDARVRLLAADTPGGAGARNTGAAAARGKYLVFADADDLVPPGAYLAMIASLDRSGSDLVIGDHLKFSPTATWSPTARWHAFDAARSGTTISAAPALLTGRACWNRMFRRAFWTEQAMTFPAVGHADDIVPMTQAVLRARTIDIVPDCVYLYRDQAGGPAASMSRRADETALLEYLQEETACVQLVRALAPDLLEQQSMLVLDADGWVHIDRYFEQLDEAEAPTPAVITALLDLLWLLDISVINDVAAERRCLFALLLIGRYDVAVRFATATRLGGSADGARLVAWAEAMNALVASMVLPDLDRPTLIADGLLKSMLHDAESVALDLLTPVMRGSSTLADRAPLQTRRRSELEEGIRAAVAADDARAVRLLSELRHHAPVVVDRVTTMPRDLELSGPARAPHLLDGATLSLRSDGSTVSSVVVVAGNRWSAQISGDDLGAGRWSVSIGLHVGTVEVRIPLVTARMPLPPVPADHLLQPLSDRKDGWRFLLDRRNPPGLLGRITSRIRPGRAPRS
ncbi:glycosyltransferase family 2 protein [Curtobacterium sp. NPDC089689]|uniref:glycosyltransferase family 2 protein n=1 Tax=Curtobacterium sp. NPDC089689 TaxID=3363968 RepID=UPI00382719A2